MQCNNCGSQLSDAAQYCPSCGGSVADSVAQKTQSAPMPRRVYANGTEDGYDWLTTLILSVFLGKLGIHRFYTGHTALGLLMLFTLGCCGIMWIVDIILIVTDSYKDSQGRPLIRKQ